MDERSSINTKRPIQANNAISSVQACKGGDSPNQVLSGVKAGVRPELDRERRGGGFRKALPPWWGAGL